MDNKFQLGIVVGGRVIGLAMESIHRRGEFKMMPPHYLAQWVAAIEKRAATLGIDPISMAYGLLQDTETRPVVYTIWAVACLAKIMEAHPELNPHPTEDVEVNLKLGKEPT